MSTAVDSLRSAPILTPDPREKRRNIPLRPSLFAHLAKREGEFCIYHSLRIITQYFQISLLPWFEKIDHCSINDVKPLVPPELLNDFLDCMDALCDSALLVPVDYDETKYLDQVRKDLFKTDHGRIRVMVMHLTGH